MSTTRPPLALATTTLRTVIERLSHHRLIIVFVIVALSHAIILGLLQGEAIQISTTGVSILGQISRAPELGLVASPSSASNNTEGAAGRTSSLTSSTANSSLQSSAVKSPSSTTASADTSSTLSASSGLSAPPTFATLFTVAPVPPSSFPLSDPPTFTALPPTQLASSFPSIIRSTPPPAIFTGFAQTAPPPAARNTRKGGEDEEEQIQYDNEVESAEDRRRRHLEEPFRRRQAATDADKRPADADNSTLFLVPGVRDVNGNVLAVTSECVSALAKPTVYIKRLQTMSTTFIFYEIWISILSFTGVMYESVPHIGAVAIAHVLAFVYSIYQVTQTSFFHGVFHEEVIVSACSKQDIIPRFWEGALQFELVIAVLEGVGSLGLAWVVHKLTKVLEWRTYHKLGADRRIARAHLVGLCFEITLQLSAFFIIAFQGIWLFELCTHEYPSDYYRRSKVLSRPYEIFLGIWTGLCVAWLAVGYFAFHRQRRRLFLIFICGDLAFLGHSLFLTTQKTFMDTQSAFKFLTFLGSVATAVAFGSLVSGIFCLIHFSAIAKAPLPFDWVAQFPSDPEKYEIEKADTRSTFQSFDDTAEELIASLPLRRPTSVAIQVGHASLVYAPSYTPGDDGALSSRESNTAAVATRFPTNATLPPNQLSPLPFSVHRKASLLSRNGSTRKAAPAHIVIREPAKRVAIAIGDSPTANLFQKGRSKSSRDSSGVESSRTADSSISDVRRSVGTFGKRADQTASVDKGPAGGLVSRWSTSTRTTESSGVATPVPSPATRKRARISNWSEAMPPGRPPGVV